MDYVFDYYYELNNSNQNIQLQQFIYDDHRFFSKMYVFLKLLGFLVYGITLVSCNKNDFFIIMIVFMFLSIMNSFRYEYAHYKRYNTTFSSINEYEIWKNQLYPKSRIFFSIIEGIIKIIFFIITFPPQFDVRNLCEIGETIFKIHILGIFIIYILFGITSMCFLWLIHCNDNSNNLMTNQQQFISNIIPIFRNNNSNEECCICMDTGNIVDWSILQCGHKFHYSCILIWISNNRTCPVCRIHVS
jgi:hypothetical protein